MKDDLIVKAIYPKTIAVKPTGSRFICEPPVVGTDEDWVILVPSRNEFFMWSLDTQWCAAVPEDDMYNDTLFDSYRLGDMNLIVTDDADYFAAWWAATVVARRLNLRERDDRVALFQEILYGGKDTLDIPKDYMKAYELGYSRGYNAGEFQYDKMRARIEELREMVVARGGNPSV